MGEADANRPATPILVELRMTVTSVEKALSSVPSVEALSTMTIASGGRVCRRIALESLIDDLGHH